MKPTPQQKEQFREALDQRMTAAGIANQTVAERLKDRGLVAKAVGERVRKWRVGENTPRGWPLVEALDEIVGAGGELVAILGSPDAGMRHELRDLGAKVEDLATQIAELRARLEGLLPQQR